jgi:hypothetical protein
MQSPFFKSILFAGLAMALALSSCTYSEGKVTRGDGNVVTHTVSINYFDEIDLSGAFNVQLTKGSELQAVVETDENLQELVDVEVKGNTLFISTTGDVILKPTKMNLSITYPELRRLSIGGACKLGSNEAIVSETLSLIISGAADIDLGIEVEVLRTQLSGAGSIQFEGTAIEHYIELSGASSLKAEKLITQLTEIDLSGAGSASIFASETLKASLSGIGSIRYYGNPAQTQIDKSGLGSIKSAE